MSILHGLVNVATRVIDALGYPGVFLLMALESMIVPVPSEAVMPFAGFQVQSGHFSSLWLVAFVATLGSLAGSLLSYGIGWAWGEPFVARYGKWFLVSAHDWERTQRFFRKSGAWGILVARFVPVVRHLISLPAGAARLRILPFLLATALGAFVWNYFLAWLGFRLAQNWDEISRRLEPFDLLVAGLLAVGVVAFLVIHIRRLRSQRPASKPEP